MRTSTCLPGNKPKQNRHSIQVGVMYEQRTQRSYQLAPFRPSGGLRPPPPPRQLVNQPLDAVDITNRVVDSVTVESFGPERRNLTGVRADGQFPRRSLLQCDP